MGGHERVRRTADEAKVKAFRDAIDNGHVSYVKSNGGTAKQIAQAKANRNGFRELRKAISRGDVGLVDQLGGDEQQLTSAQRRASNRP